MLDLGYKILQSIYLNGGKKDLDKLIFELIENLTDDEKFTVRRNIVGKIVLWQRPEYDFIQQLPLSTGATISNKYYNTGWASRLDENEIVIVEITSNGIKEYFSLNALYNPPKQEPSVTNIYHAPVIKDNLNSNISIGDNSKQELNKAENAPIIQESENVDLRPAENPIEKPTTKNNSKMPTIIQKVLLWIISNIWQFILLVAAAVFAAWFIIKFAVPH